MSLKKPQMEKFSQAFISERAGVAILDYLADETALSKSKLKSIMQIGGIWRKPDMDEPYRVHNFKEKIKLNDEIHLYYDEAILKLAPAKLVCESDHGSFSYWYKPKTMLKNPHLYCDHLSFSRAIERDLPQHLNITLILPDHDDLYGKLLLCHTNAKAASIDPARLSGVFRFVTQQPKLFTELDQFYKVKDSRSGFYVTCKTTFHDLYNVVNKIKQIQPQNEDHPWLECLSIDAV